MHDRFSRIKDFKTEFNVFYGAAAAPKLKRASHAMGVEFIHGSSFRD